MATPVYVNPAVAGPGTGTTGDPYKSVDTAYTNVDAGGTVLLRPGTYDDTTQGAAWGVNFDIVDKDVTFESETTVVTLIPTAVNGFQRLAARGDCNITFKDVIIDASGTTTYGIFMNNNSGSAAGSLTLDNCQTTSGASTATIRCTDIVSFEMKNGSTVTNTLNRAVQLDGDINKVEIEPSSGIFTTDLTSVVSHGLVLTGLTDTIEWVNVYGSTFDCGKNAISAPTDMIDSMTLKNNTFISRKVDMAGPCLNLGYEDENVSAWLTATDYNPGNIVKNDGFVFKNVGDSVSGATTEPLVGADWQTEWIFLDGFKVVCSNNTISSVSGHTVFFGFGCNGSELDNNHITAGNFGVVIKSNHCEGNDNIIVGAATGIGVFSGFGNTLHNNTINITAGSGIVFGNHNGAISLNNRAYNNIIKLGSGGSFIIFDEQSVGSPVGIGNHDLDYNCYWSEASEPWYNFQDTASNRLTNLLSFWGTSGEMLASKLDQNSIEVDPQLDANNKPQNPILNGAGKPDANGDSTAIGAIQPAGTNGTSIYGTKQSIYA